MYDHRGLLDKLFELKLATRTMTRAWSIRFWKLWVKCRENA